MIRPVSQQQMQLQSPRKPRINASSPLKNSSTTFPKSPIKKHLQNASVFAVETTSDEKPSSSTLHGPLLRASVLQAVLKLLDQDVNALAGAHEVLQAAAALPLAEPNVHRACVQALRGLHESSMASSFVYDSSSPSNTNWDVYETVVLPSSPRKMKAIQHARSNGSLTGNSLHHCKEFLLACANEIYELEDVRPVNFDYAEDTSSSSSVAQPSESQSGKMCKHCGAANFDYASTVLESSDSIGSDASSEDDEDTLADQGSQFSEVLHRAEYISDVDSDDDVESTSYAMSMSDRVACRKVLQALHEHVQAHRVTQRRSSAPILAVKFRVFEVLKLQASLTRKRLAFQGLKNGLRSRHQPSSTPKALVKARPAEMSFWMLILHHSDTLLLLLVLVFLANLPAKYIM